MSAIHVKIYDSKIKLRKNGDVILTRYHSKITKDKQVNPFLYDDEKKESLIENVGRVSRAVALENESSIRQDSLSRSRNLLIDYASHNFAVWKSFVTLTIADNVTDVSEANKIFHIWRTRMTRLCKKNGVSLMYLGAPEFQKRGSVHYHLLTNLEPGSIFLPEQSGKKNMYDVMFWNVGYSSVFDLQLTDDHFNCALYITKYLYKDLDERLFGHTRVLKSNNLEKPPVFELLAENEVFKQAMDYIKKEKYDFKGSFIVTNNDNPYFIPFTRLAYSSSLSSQEDYKQFLEILQGD